MAEVEADIYATCKGSSDVQRRIFGDIVHFFFLFGAHLKKKNIPIPAEKKKKKNHFKITREKIF